MVYWIYICTLVGFLVYDLLKEVFEDHQRSKRRQHDEYVGKHEKRRN